MFFGESMVLGKYESQKVFGNSVSEYERSLKRTTIEILVDMAAWFGEKNILLFSLFLIKQFSGVFLGISVLSLAEILYWVLKAFTGSS